MADKTGEVVGLINHCLLTLLSTPSFKEEVGLRYVSHLRGGIPYWYFWFSRCDGVYRLELHSAQEVGGYDWLAEFTVKYYPRDTEASYHGLSVVEKTCRKSDAFHTHPPEGSSGCPCQVPPAESTSKRFADLGGGTGVPSFKYEDVIPGDFFYAGNMCLAFKACVGSLLRVKSQTKWRVTLVEDYRIAGEDGSPVITMKKGEIDRDYPGSALCGFFFQKFVQAWILFNNYTVQDECAWTGEGTAFTSDGQRLWPNPSSEIKKTVTQAELSLRPEDNLPSLPDEDIARMGSLPKGGSHEKNPLCR